MRVKANVLSLIFTNYGTSNSLIMTMLNNQRQMKLRPLYFLLAIPILMLLLIYWPTHHFFTNQYDDSYITYRYAINLAEGNGLVFNVGERTDSASSFLYTIVLSVFWFFGFKNLEFVGGLIGIISVGFICVYVYKLAIHLTRNKMVGMIVAIGCGLNGFLSGWALSGMETLLWSGIVLFAIYLMVTEASYLLVILAISAAAFTRFEGIFLVAPYFFLLLNRTKAKIELSLLAGVVAAFCIFYILKHEYYGVWISHAFQMKEIAAYYKPAPQEILKNWAFFGSIPFLVGAYALSRKEYRPILLYMVISMLSVMLGPKSDWSRYSVHLLPLFYVFSAIGLSEIQLWVQKELIKKVAFISIAFLMVIQAVGGQYYNYRNMVGLADHQICRKKLGLYIESNIPYDKYIASSDLGAISYMAINHHFVDLIALTSSDVLANYEQGETMDGILENKRVEYIADTFIPKGENRFNALLRQFPRVTSKSSFNIDTDNPEFSCSANGTLYFQLSKIKNTKKLRGQV